MVEITQEYFSSIAQNINGSIYNFESEYYDEILTLGSEEISVKKIVESDGYVVLDVSEKIYIEEFLQKEFGDFMVEKNPNKYNFTKLQYSPGAKFYALSSLAQPIHTDEGYTKQYPKFIALHCHSESTSGGASIIVKLKPLLEIISGCYPTTIEQLFDVNSLLVHNASGCENKPLLFNFDNDKVGISYSPVLKKIECNHQVAEIFKFITAYVHDVKNQLRFKLKKNQILILDNRITLHGRTSFAKTEKRIFYRYWMGQEKIC